MRKSSVPRIVFRCDAGDLFGGGHAMRCLTLANELAAKGASITFVSAVMPDAMVERIVGAGHRIKRIPSSPELHREGPGWEEPALTGTAQLADAKATGAAVSRADWVIIDHYLLDARWHSAARAFADQVLVIDDLANRSCDCDVMLDQTFGRTAEEYRELVPSNAKILAGSIYALLRPEFVRERSAALERRHAVGAVRRILISMGITDPGGITAQILDRVLSVASECAIDVVVGPQSPSLEHIRRLTARNHSISIHENSDRMAELMRDADIAIGAAGTTSWERCCLGLPTITLVLAENQRLIAANLEHVGAIFLADSPDAIPALLREIADDGQTRLSTIAAAAAIVDGCGADRVGKYMLGPAAVDPNHLRLRLAGAADRETLWLWRNDPLMRTMAKRHDPITWPEHARWFAGVMECTRTTLYIADLRGEAAAMVRFDGEDGEALVSINVAPSMRGRGVGTAALIRACEAYGRHHSGVTLIAEIDRANAASKAAFRAAGFEELDQGTVEIAKFIRRGAPSGAAAIVS